MKGWLDNYNDSKASAPEGFQGDGYSNVGRNYSPAWGGQFQMGGNVYPVNYVPQAQMGGSLPGATGHMYARIGAPSNGKYAKKTLASAQKGKTVKYGTPEYEEAYNKGEVITKEGVRSPILLDEVVVKGKKKDKNWLEQYADKIVDENKDAGVLGAILGTPISAVTSLPQLMGMKAFTGEMERPSEGLDIDNPYGAFAVDAIADPANLIGIGELSGLNKLTKEEALSKLANVKNIRTSVHPELTQDLITNGFSLNDLNPFKFKPKSNKLYSELNDEKIIEEFIGKRNITNAQKKIWNNTPSMKSKYLLEADPTKEVFNNGLSLYDIPLDHLQGSNIYKKNWLGNYKRIEPVNYFHTDIHGNDLNPYKESSKVQYSDFIHPEQAANLAHEARNDYQKLFDIPMPESLIRTNELYPDVANNWMTEGIERNAVKDYMHNRSMMPESWEGFYNKFKGFYDWDIKHSPEKKAGFDLNFTDITPEEKNYLFSNIQKQKDGGVIKDDMGYWNPDNWGKDVEIDQSDPDSFIDMEGVYEPLLGVSDKGERRVMYPGEKHKFKKGTKKVTESRIAKNGLRQEQKGLQNLDQLTNFTNYNTKQPGGWLDTL